MPYLFAGTVVAKFLKLENATGKWTLKLLKIET